MKHPKVFTLHPIDQTIRDPRWEPSAARSTDYPVNIENGKFVPHYIPPIAYFYPTSADFTPEELQESQLSLREAILKERLSKSYRSPDTKSVHKPTDLFFLILLVLFFGFLGYLLFEAIVIKHSNPNLILHGYDNWGNICGQKNRPLDNVPYSGQDMFRKPYLLIYFGTNRTTRRICVENCNEAIFIKTTFNRCLPRRVGLENLASTVNYTRGIIDSISSDIILCFKELVYLFIVSFVFALLLVILIRFMASLIIWFTLIILSIALITGTTHIWLYWGDLKFTNNSTANITQPNLISDSEPDKAERWLVYCIGATVFTTIFLLVLLVMRKRIQLVCLLFKEAGKAIGSMPLLLLQPILTLIILCGLGFLWFIGTLYLMSNRIPMVDPESGFVVYGFEPLYSYVKWINIFAILWLIYFVTACQHYVIAGSVSKWFFQRDKSQLNYPIFRSMLELIKYHLGSIALGSLLVVGMKIIRLLFKKIETLTNRTKDSLGCMNKFCYFFFWIFEKFLIYINKNAYIVMAIHGYSFSTSAKRAFSILSSNTLKIATINSIGDFLLLLGKLSVISLTLIVGTELTKEKMDKLNHPWSPLLVSAIFAYFISHCFLAVYEMTIDTLFICFCEETSNESETSIEYGNGDFRYERKRSLM
ncbi:choline transporter-like protein 1 [Tetranychus urticae]|uniref:Choline transporter-like protein n=1 Tax=Tetranychus urticae TaxID=32264 RepID=T1L4D1_TETUR|nr:choline transporter-like protein 1 [Tetranychus urticae]